MWGRGGPGCTRTLGPGKGRCELRRGSRGSLWRSGCLLEAIFRGFGVRGDLAGPLCQEWAWGGGASVGQVPMGPPNRPEVLRRSPIWRPLGTGRPVTIGSTRPLLPHRPAWPVSSGPTQCPVTQRAGHLDVHSHMPPLLEHRLSAWWPGGAGARLSGGPHWSVGNRIPPREPPPWARPLVHTRCRAAGAEWALCSGRALQSCLHWEGPPCSSLTAVLEAEGPRSFPSGLARRRAALSPLGKYQSLRGRERAGRAGPTGAGHVWPSVGSGLRTFWVFTLWLKRPT